jgi:hypothetical protein
MYSPPYRIDRDEVFEARERFRKDAEEGAGVRSFAGYSMLGAGTAYLAAGSAAGATTDDSTLRVAYISGAALGAALIVFSRGAFDTSAKSSGASGMVARALTERDPYAMNAACLDADLALRFGPLAPPRAAAVVSVPTSNAASDATSDAEVTPPPEAEEASETEAP